MYLYDFVPGKFEIRNIGSAARHQIPIEDTEDAFVSNDEKIVLLAFELENDWL